MPENTEACPSCGRPTPVGTRCVYCATVTDLDLKSLQLDYLKQSDSKAPEEPIQNTVVVVVQKTGQRYSLKTSKVKIGRD
ncbi:MAG TPA: hypothetical protein PKW73_08990, partial [Candidatus Obscuribacter sp.]|nr:hypothetical protein [Candidatus Obscuribacter sp.]